jgi:hypothetical protein
MESPFRGGETIPNPAVWKSVTLRNRRVFLESRAASSGRFGFRGYRTLSPALRIFREIPSRALKNKKMLA